MSSSVGVFSPRQPSKTPHIYTRLCLLSTSRRRRSEPGSFRTMNMHEGGGVIGFVRWSFDAQVWDEGSW